jgi:hypothetical protein
MLAFKISSKMEKLLRDANIAIPVDSHAATPFIYNIMTISLMIIWIFSFLSLRRVISYKNVDIKEQIYKVTNHINLLKGDKPPVATNGDRTDPQ